jgi:transglutaminase-like putative cysteine protease
MEPRPSIRHVLCLFLLAVALAVPAPRTALARLNLAEDAPATLTLDEVTIEVARDGSFVEEEAREVLIRNEAGRLAAGSMGIVYNARVAKVEVLSAETRIDGKTLPVPPEAIEDKPVATNLPGFDEIARITVPYTGVQVGSRVRLRKKTTQREVAFPGHYSRAFFPGTDLACEHFDVTIRSKRPLQVAVNDPDQAFDVAHSMDGDTDTLRVKLKKPTYRHLVEEQGSSYLPASRLPYVQVTTDDSLDGPAAPVAAAYEKTISGPLPPLLEEQAKAFAGSGGTFPDRLDAFTSSFSQRIRYFGDWRPRNGGYVPRPLEDIASSQYGDCKDMATAVAAILRKAGVRADVAWIHRSPIPPDPLPLASPHAFNHAIVRVVHDGSTYWLDPTNNVSFARGIPNDLAGRDALVLEAGKLRKERVPFPPPEAGVARGTGSYAFTPDGNARITARLELLGQQAVWLTGIGRYAAPETVKFAILRGFSDGRRVVSGTVGDFDMLSPVVRDISIGVTVEIEGAAIRTTAGLAYRLEHNSLKTFSVVDPEKDQGDLFLGTPNIAESVDRIPGGRLVGRNPDPCRVSSPWVDASWEIREDGGALLVSSRVTRKKPVLTGAEIAGPAFADLQKGLRQCFGDFALVFEPRPEK